MAARAHARSMRAQCSVTAASRSSMQPACCMAAAASLPGPGAASPPLMPSDPRRDRHGPCAGPRSGSMRGSIGFLGAACRGRRAARGSSTPLAASSPDGRCQQPIPLIPRYVAALSRLEKFQKVRVGVGVQVKSNRPRQSVIPRFCRPLPSMLRILPDGSGTLLVAGDLSSLRTSTSAPLMCKFAWERSASGGQWEIIPGSSKPSYTPGPQDSGCFLRASATPAHAAVIGMR